MAKIPVTSTCPCGGASYALCCQPLHEGTPAPTAEALMRSRYSAYVLRLEDYLLKTWHPDTRPTTLGLSDDAPARWLGLQIKRAVNTSENTAIVEFVARYKVNGKAQRLHETSRFERIKGQWLYCDGQLEN